MILYLCKISEAAAAPPPTVAETMAAHAVAAASTQRGMLALGARESSCLALAAFAVLSSRRLLRPSAFNFQV